MKYQLDATNLLCPMPVIRTQNRVAELAEGDILEVRCTDPGVLHDIPAWCRINGHEVLDQHRDDASIIITVKVHGD
ncbi:MAG: recombinase [Gammaproteobacteria bacterium]|nr:MAG: recombinase [Gammaproteobacteria bacterium]